MIKFHLENKFSNLKDQIFILEIASEDQEFSTFKRRGLAVALNIEFENNRNQLESFYLTISAVECGDSWRRLQKV